MILLIDAGNSRLKLGLLPAGAAHREADTHAFDHANLQALADWLRALPAKPTRAVGVNVAGAERGDAIARVVEQAGGGGTAWLRAEKQTLILRNGYAHPEQLGADRWAAMLGVLARQPARHPPLMIASFGTATTLDTVSSENVFLGGLILPGPAMMRAALAHGTANLPLAQGLATAYPTDTDQAISSGVAAAQAGALVRQWLAARTRFGATPDIYVTGGGWSEVRAEVETLLAQAGAARSVPTGLIYVESPVLDGLAAWVLQTEQRPE
ncbi:type III pantothenate kinase [Bordetella sp. FB-8]|uniref:type III pantothenate kinase n=1 Tax=Bordetella sp. FB-8 TaxID=1159870 RepID=UPI00037B15AE|nr:type III pantothenate kinase [Bordetella sp. FB-8]